MQSQDQKPKILDQVRSIMRLHHYSIHTERSYIDWIKRYIAFHLMKSREDLAGGERKIEVFLTHLAVDEQVASATQNQAMNEVVMHALGLVVAEEVLLWICHAMVGSWCRVPWPRRYEQDRGDPPVL